jgi:hypothetical protein
VAFSQVPLPTEDSAWTQEERGLQQRARALSCRLARSRRPGPGVRDAAGAGWAAGAEGRCGALAEASFHLGVS